MTLARLLVVADAETGGGRLPEIVADAVHYGARCVMLRARRLPPTARVELAATLRRMLDPVGGTLIVAGGPGEAGRWGEAGSSRAAGSWGEAVQLAAQEPFPSRRPALVGRSCHDAAEVSQAADEGCDYVTVSPVYPTESKPGYGPPLGPAGLAALCRPGLPVYALGGVLPEHVAECLAAGAYGVAVMGPILRSPALVADYLKELTA